MMAQQCVHATALRNTLIASAHTQHRIRAGGQTQTEIPAPCGLGWHPAKYSICGSIRKHQTFGAVWPTYFAQHDEYSWEVVKRRLRAYVGCSTGQTLRWIVFSAAPSMREYVRLLEASLSIARRLVPSLSCPQDSTWSLADA